MSALPDYAEALGQALRGITPAGRIESIDLENAGGRVLAADILADRDLPPFNRAQMDGYALRASEFAPGKGYPVCTKIAAGSSAEVKVSFGQCVAIATGAPLPPDVDAVIQHEMSDRGDHQGRPVRFTIDSIKLGQAVHPCGADARCGDVLINAGTLLEPQHLGIAAAVGANEVRVFTKPRAAVLTSGDEVVPAETLLADLKAHQIRNSNGPMVNELLRRMGAEPASSQHLADEKDQTIAAVKRAIADHDMVVTIGGVSAGERDYFPTAFEICGVKRSLQGASIQPGRPIVVGVAPNGCVVIGLPGNPVSVLACACLFAWPIVRTMLGLDPALPWREVELAEAVKPNPQRRAFRPAIVQNGGRVIVPSWAGSGDLAHTSTTHGLAELPVQNDVVTVGTQVRFLPWP